MAKGEQRSNREKKKPKADKNKKDAAKVSAYAAQSNKTAQTMTGKGKK